MKLKDKLPIEFMGCEFDNCRARKFVDMEVIQEHDARQKRWIGKHKNITYWWELENGYAIGMNESPIHGLGFPVEKMQ